MNTTMFLQRYFRAQKDFGNNLSLLQFKLLLFFLKDIFI